MDMLAGLLNRRTFCAAGAGTVAIGFARMTAAAEEPSDAMITQLAKFKLKLDKEAEALEAIRQMCAAVEEHEPGVLIYLAHRSTKQPEEVVFYEVYKDKEALKAHSRTPHMAKLFASFASLFSGPPEIVRLDRVGGFSR